MPTIEERLHKIYSSLDSVYGSFIRYCRKLAAEGLPIPEAKERALQQIEMKIDATNNS